MGMKPRVPSTTPLPDDHPLRQIYGSSEALDAARARIGETGSNLTVSRRRKRPGNGG